MSISDKYLALEQSVMPVLFDNNATAHRLSSRIFNRHGIVSFIYGKRRFRDMFDISSKTLKLPYTNDAQLIVQELSELADKYSDMLPLLITCSEKAENIVKQFSDELQTRYIIISENELLSDSPIEYLAKAFEASKTNTERC